MSEARPRVVHGIEELRAFLAAERAERTQRGEGARVVLVPTMGALHAGHLSHVRRARELGDIVVVSIFVNPLQFGPTEDLDRYPRTLEADVSALATVGADAVFAPSASEMYPDGATGTLVTGGQVTRLFEGASRPGHFDGMLTVVAKLLAIVGPDVATFGRKDAQQLFLVRRMVRDLNIPVRIEAIDIVREDDGLALSSRNRYLSADERQLALALSAALLAAGNAAGRGVTAALDAALGEVTARALVELDYFAVVDPGTFLPVDDGYRGEALALVAARVGSTRLIDNATITVAPGEH
jgi:pantoate--beta-alanine ligase